MMSTRLLLLFCLTEHVFTKQLPDVDCVVVHLKYVQCFWNKLGTPQSNFTFYGWFHFEKPMTECTSYLSEKGINIGCNQPYAEKSNRFKTFYTTLKDGNNNHSQTHTLRQKVMLYPPTNLTVQMESDLNLWLYWNQTNHGCVESEIRYKINNKEWDTTKVSTGKQNHCINLPCTQCKYELQVRSRFGYSCAESLFWSNWSEPAAWGFDNSPDTDQMKSMSVWTPVLIVVGFITLILLVMMLLHHDRLRIILIPLVPKPALIPRDIEDWFQHSKGLEDRFKPNYNERACTVQEYTQISQSDSEGSVSSTSSVTTDQSYCSVLISADEPDPAPLQAPEV
ncbi:cytokine receptor common subunit gamma-like [Labrus bergylta]|uniref:cytokine receptor common subunit gamma-like n=1 Tax=Labrus bergylta TaxID=56723 RepID=UPI0033137AF0